MSPYVGLSTAPGYCVGRITPASLRGLCRADEPCAAPRQTGEATDGTQYPHQFERRIIRISLLCMPHAGCPEPQRSNPERDLRPDSPTNRLCRSARLRLAPAAYGRGVPRQRLCYGDALHDACAVGLASQRCLRMVNTCDAAPYQASEAPATPLSPAPCSPRLSYAEHGYGTRQGRLSNRRHERTSHGHGRLAVAHQSVFTLGVVGIRADAALGFGTGVVVQ